MKPSSSSGKSLIVIESLFPKVTGRFAASYRCKKNDGDEWSSERMNEVKLPRIIIIMI